MRLFIMSAAFGANNVLNKIVDFQMITIKETIFKISSRVLFFFLGTTQIFLREFWILKRCRKSVDIDGWKFCWLRVNECLIFSFLKNFKLFKFFKLFRCLNHFAFLKAFEALRICKSFQSFWISDKFISSRIISKMLGF